MKFPFCKKTYFKKTEESFARKIATSWLRFTPTAYKVSDSWTKKFMANNKEIMKFVKYMKNKNIMYYRIVYIDYPTPKYRLDVKSMSILRGISKKVRYIFEDSVVDVFLRISNAEEMKKQNRKEVVKPITPELLVLSDVYEPRKININLDYVKKKTMGKNQYASDEKIKALFFSLILFTIDKLKEKAAAYDIIEFRGNDIIGSDSIFLFHLSFQECTYDYIYLEVKSFSIWEDNEEPFIGTVRFISKKEGETYKVEEKKLDDFLEEIIEDFREYIKIKTGRKRYAFSKKAKMVMKQIIVYSIGVFSMHYIMHLVDFNEFYKDNFVYREIMINITLDELEKVLKIKTDNLEIIFKKYNENFWEYIYSTTKDSYNVYAIFKDKNGFTAIAHPFDMWNQCDTYKSNLDENFLFLVHNYSDERDVVKNFLLRFIVKNISKVLNLLTGYQYSKDFIYKNASYILYDSKKNTRS